MYKIIEPLVKFRGRPFKYRLLFPIIVVGISAIVAFLYANAKYVHYTLGNALYLKGQYDPAIAEYKEAIRLKPDYALAHNNLGMALKRGR